MQQKQRFVLWGLLLMGGVGGLGYALHDRSEAAGSDATGVFRWTHSKTDVEMLEERVRTLEAKVLALQQGSFVGSVPTRGGSTETVATTQEKGAAVEPSKDQIREWTSTWKARLAELDQDHDGKISSLESDMTPETFRLMDENRDGYVDEKESKRMQSYLEQAEAYLRKREKGDGSYPITRPEFQGQEQEFSYVDRDQNGAVSEWEYVQFIQESREQRRRFDTDDDGKISVKEMGVSPERFSRMDNDQDGFISLWEIRRALYKGVW